jgi:hypothetical protein
VSTTTVPEGMRGVAMTDAQRRFTLAFSEIAECLRDLASVTLMPANETAVSKVSGVAAGLDRAARRLRETILSLQPEPAKAAAVTEEMVNAADDEMTRQWRESPWEDAKDVIEGLDLAPVIRAALAAAPPTTTKDTRA